MMKAIRSLRVRMFFWFLFFASFAFIVKYLNDQLNQQQAEINAVQSNISRLHNTLLHDLKVQRDFFYYETTNPYFFEHNTSSYLNAHDSLTQRIKNSIDQLSGLPAWSSFHTSGDLNRLKSLFNNYNNLFDSITSALNHRGYKDFGIIGKMRKAVHNLEDMDFISSSILLTLRRHEKDYIIRNEARYIYNVQETAAKLQSHITNNTELDLDTREKALKSLKNYLDTFEKLLTADQKIGLRNQSGLKADLEQSGDKLEAAFLNLKQRISSEQDLLLADLKNTYSYLFAGLLLAVVLISFLISGAVSKPIKQLTQQIDGFIKSDFKKTDKLKIKRNIYELQKLTDSYDLMKSQIVSHIDDLNQKVAERTADLAKINAANEKFVPKEFVQFLGYHSIVDVQLGDHVQKNMTIMFADIRSFTAHSEGMTPKDNFGFINEYLNHIGPEIRKNDGFIDKYIGDEIMALFPQSPGDCVKAALDVQRKLDEYNEERASRGYTQPIRIGMGIHKGDMILGTIGETERTDTTVISDAVNIASRMEGLTKLYKTRAITTVEMVQALKDDDRFHFRFLDAVKVYGKESPSYIYEILDPLPEEERNQKLKTQDQFEESVEHFLNGSIHKALFGFQLLADLAPLDKTTEMFIGRCESMIENDLINQWDGFTRLSKV